MAGVICVWALVPDEKLAWYEGKFVPGMREKTNSATLHCELTETGFGAEPIGKLDSPWPLCTIYYFDDIHTAKEGIYDKSNYPADDLMKDSLASARFDTKTFRELKTWQAEDWDGGEYNIYFTYYTLTVHVDLSRVASVVAMEWRVAVEFQDDVFEFYTSQVAPMFADSEGMLRVRLFEVEDSTSLQGSSFDTKERDPLHGYFTLVELDTEEWPWEDIVELGSSKEWKRYFEDPKAVVGDQCTRRRCSY
jgi:hypothetical protein